jgi:hypothetical protein
VSASLHLAIITAVIYATPLCFSQIGADDPPETQEEVTRFLISHAVYDFIGIETAEEVAREDHMVRYQFEFGLSDLGTCTMEVFSSGNRSVECPLYQTEDSAIGKAAFEAYNLLLDSVVGVPWTDRLLDPENERPTRQIETIDRVIVYVWQNNDEETGQHVGWVTVERRKW